MTSTFEGGRIVVSPGFVEVDGRRFLVTPETRVEAIVDPPHIKLWLVMLGLSLLAVPSAAIAGTLWGGAHPWLIALPMPVAVASIIRVLTATTQYHVALVTNRRTLFVYSSEDLQTVVFLVAMVGDAIPPG